MIRGFTNLKIAYKLGSGFILLFILLASVLAIQLISQSTSTYHHDAYTRRLIPAQQAAREMLVLISTIDDSVLTYLTADNSIQARNARKSYYQQVHVLRSQLYKAKVLTSIPAQSRLLANFEQSYFGRGGRFTYNEQLFTLKRSGDQLTALKNYETSSMLLEPVKNYVNINDQLLIEDMEDEIVSERNELLFILMLDGVAILSGILIAVLITRSIIRPLAQVQTSVQAVSSICIASLAQGLTALAKGDWSVASRKGTLPPSYESRDEIGQIAESVRTIISDVHQTIDGYELARIELQELYDQVEEKNQILSLANIHLQSQATSDALTGLPNHRVVMGQITSNIANAQSKDQSFALIFVDVDHFKQVNDTWGHRAGDAVLREVGSRLSSHLREEDFVGRYGGEEFAVILSNVDQERALEIAHKLLDAVREKPCYWESEDDFTVTTINVTASFGVALYPHNGETRDALLEAADKAMYNAKHTGRNRICIYNGSLEARMALSAARERKQAEAVAVHTLSAVAHVHDNDTGQHAQRMVRLAMETARVLGRSEEEIYLIKVAALLHDIGKVAIPSEIVRKPGPLTDQEWNIMRRHPRISQQILQEVGGRFELVSHMVLAHHERWDGSGYPYGLSGEAIPLGARILSVVDSYDAMISERPYKKALSLDEARAELLRCQGTQFDPQVVETFLAVLDQQHQSLLEYQGLPTALERDEAPLH